MGAYKPNNGSYFFCIILSTTGNCLSVLPSTIGSLSSLRTLDFSDNSIVHIPKTLAYIRTLEVRLFIKGPTPTGRFKLKIWFCICLSVCPVTEPYAWHRCYVLPTYVCVYRGHRKHPTLSLCWWALHCITVTFYCLCCLMFINRPLTPSHNGSALWTGVCNILNICLDLIMFAGLMSKLMITPLNESSRNPTQCKIEIVLILCGWCVFQSWERNTALHPSTSCQSWRVTRTQLNKTLIASMAWRRCGRYGSTRTNNLKFACSAVF